MDLIPIYIKSTPNDEEPNFELIKQWQAQLNGRCPRTVIDFIQEFPLRFGGDGSVAEKERERERERERKNINFFTKDPKEKPAVTDWLIRVL